MPFHYVDNSELYYGYSKNVLLIMDYVYSEIKPKDMTDAEFYTLCVLHRKGPMALSDIAESIDLSLGSMTRTSSSLESKGLAVRQSSGTGRKRTILHLTDQGSDVASAMYAKYRKVVEFCTIDLSEEEHAELCRINKTISRTVLEADSKLD